MSEPADAPRRRWPRVVLVVSGVLALSAVAAILYLDARGNRGLEKELAAWRASGDPLLALQDQPATSELPEALRNWLASYDRPPCNACGDALDEAAIQALADCAQPYADAKLRERAFDEACVAALRDPVRARALTDCERALLEARCAPSLACAAGARAARELPVIPARELLSGGRPLEQVAGTVNILSLVRASRCAVDAMRYRMLHGELDEAAEFARDGFEIARVASGTPLLTGYLGWTVTLNLALGGLEELLQALPPGTDLVWFESELARLDPRLELIDGVREERLAAHNTLRRFSSADIPGVHVVTPDEALSWLDRRMLGVTHDEYLEGFARALAHLESPAWREPPAAPYFVPASWPFSAFFQHLDLIRPNFEPLIDVAVMLAARIELARAALVNHRDGTAAARAWLAGRIDPFDGKPLRSRVDPDGVLVMWSVGVDRVDDGAPRRPPGCIDWKPKDIDWLSPVR
ncbi:MAG: hypothetical protein HZA52_10670 [Planctomycetes bacterium]|nr:hypothetical protein [Planctomycetota bacterium]